MFENPVNFTEDYTPELFAAQMFANTDANGELWLMDWYDIDCEDCSTYNDFNVEIHWTKHNLFSLIVQYRQLFNHLELIAKEYDFLDGTPKTAEKLLPNQQVIDTYFTFIMPFSAQTKNEVYEEVEARVGKGICNYELIGHVQRLCKLLYLGASGLVVYNEGRHVMASLALFQFATAKQKIFDPVPLKIRHLRSAWLSLLDRAENNQPFSLEGFQEAYQQTVELFAPYCTKADLPKDVMPVFLFAYRFGSCPCQRDAPTQKAAQKLTVALLHYFSFTKKPFEEGTTVDQQGTIVPLPFHNFEKSMNLASTIL